MLLPSSFSTNWEIVISTEAAHGLIVSSEWRNPLLPLHFAFASSCLTSAANPRPPPKDLPDNPSDIHSQTPIKIPASQSEESTGEHGEDMATQTAGAPTISLTREQLIDLLNEDLAREFQAIIAYVNYSQVLKGAAYMNIAAELAVHATEELSHALIISNQIDYLGGMPTTVPKPVKTSEKAEDMLRFDLDNENETIRQYRRRIKQCDELNEFATAEQIRQILLQEQDHQISLATALGIDVPNVGIAD
jgi:bacterioferritin